MWSPRPSFSICANSTLAFSGSALCLPLPSSPRSNCCGPLHKWNHQTSADQCQRPSTFQAVSDLDCTVVKQDTNAQSSAQAEPHHVHSKPQLPSFSQDGRNYTSEGIAY